MPKMVEKYRLRLLENLVLIKITKMKFVILACYPEEIHYSCTKESSQNVVLPNRS